MVLGGDSHCPTHAAILAPPPLFDYFYLLFSFSIIVL